MRLQTDMACQPPITTFSMVAMNSIARVSRCSRITKMSRTAIFKLLQKKKKINTNILRKTSPFFLTGVSVLSQNTENVNDRTECSLCWRYRNTLFSCHFFRLECVDHATTTLLNIDLVKPSDHLKEEKTAHSSGLNPPQSKEKVAIFGWSWRGHSVRIKNEGNTRINVPVPCRCLSGVSEGGVTITVKLCHYPRIHLSHQHQSFKTLLVFY